MLSRLALLLPLLLASAALAQRPAGIGAVYGAVGYMAPDDELTADGESQLIEGNFSVLSATLGIEAHFVKVAGLTGTLGVAFDFAQAKRALGDEPFDSGFAPQNVRPYAHLSGDAFVATLGYLRDIGANQDDAEADDVNTDGQDAVWLGLSGRYEVGPAAVFAGGDAFLTRPVTRAPATGPAEFDFGDVYVVHGGAAVRSRMVELGVRVQYLTSTESSTQAGSGDTRRAQVGLTPYLRIDPEGDPVHFALMMGARGGLNQEYAPFGITLGGRSVPAPRSPISLSLRIDI